LISLANPVNLWLERYGSVDHVCNAVASLSFGWRHGSSTDRLSESSGRTSTVTPTVRGHYSQPLFIARRHLGKPNVTRSYRWICLIQRPTSLGAQNPPHKCAKNFRWNRWVFTHEKNQTVSHTNEPSFQLWQWWIKNLLPILWDESGARISAKTQ